MIRVTTNVSADPHSTGRWQAAKRKASELALDLPDPAPGTHVYIVTEGLRNETVLLLRAFTREAARAGAKVRLL